MGDCQVKSELLHFIASYFFVTWNVREVTVYFLTPLVHFSFNFTQALSLPV